MMMATRNDIKDRLIHNQSPYPTKDKVLSYTIPVDHSESLLFCSSSGASTTSSQDNGSLSFITSEDDPCNGRDSLASFLDEGLGTSLDGVDEISSPIFPTLGRNDSGIFSSDEGGAAGGSLVGSSTSTTITHNHNSPPPPHHATLIPPPISSSTSTCSTISSGSSSASSNSNIISVGEVVSWKGCQSGGNTSGGILLSPAGAGGTTTTISVVTDSATGIPSIICSSTPNTNSSGPTVKLETRQLNSTGSGGGGTAPASGKGAQQTCPQQQALRCKSMPLGRQGPQKCTICDKVFSNASALTKHKLTHSDERRHACATCGKAFKRQDHLNGHMLTHRNKKPFECKSKGCGKSYCDARSLRRHVENRHGHDVLESMNLTSHHHGKHSNKNNNNNHNNQQQNHQQHHEPPQPELVPTVTFTPVLSKCDPKSSQPSERNSGKSKILDCMPVLQPEQPQLEASSGEKATAQPPILQKCGESNNTNLVPNIQLQSSPGLGGTTTLPIVLKRENVSVFDFDESVEDPPQIGVSFPHQEKLISSLSNATIKVGNVIDSSKLGPLPDLRLIQEWTKRLGDSKVALFLASSSAASSLTQFAGPMASIQLAGDGQASGIAAGSAAFIPTSENGLFSVTPISLVPTSSGEFTFKPATISVPSTDSPKSLYILPSDPALSTLPPPPTISIAAQPPPPPINIITSSPSSSSLSSFNITTAGNNGGCLNTSSSLLLAPKQEPASPRHPPHPPQKKEGKASKNEKAKSAIGQSLANRIKTKLKAGSLKKLGKASKETGASNSKSSSIVISKPSEDNGPRLALQQQLPLSIGGGGIPTISITAGGISATTWCESPKECQNGNVSMEEDRLSEGAEGEDKPVECSICCRRFKNTPALNGHMRLHGGYFKKETEGSKKKDQVSKEPTHSTPLQTASVSVRALIEEKIKERRNNLLKLAAATAEKAASEGASQSSTSETSQHHPAPSQSSKSKSGSEKAASTSSSLVAAAQGGDPSSENKSQHQQHQQQSQMSATIPTTIIAQQSKLVGETLKLKLEPNTCSLMEKDRNCDQDTNNFSRDIIINGTSNNCNNNSISNNCSNLNNGAPPPTMVLDHSFHELDILIGDSSNMVGGRVMNGSHNLQQHHDLLTPQLLRDPLQSNSNSNGGFPLVDKSNFTFLDCDLNADDLCQAFHLIYVDNNNGTDLPLTMDQDTLGKVSKMFQDPIPELSSLGVSLGDSQDMKHEISEPVVCLPHDDPCNLPWEWRNSTSSDNTENSFGNVQDCVNSLLCTSSSDTPDESSTKDPVAGGGYCYTPILSPNSTFCLTPGPDSPFETTSHSLSFISPSPTMGNGSGFSDPSSTLGNPSSSEPLFSSEQPSLQNMNISMSSETTPSTGPSEDDTLQKFSQVTSQQMDAPFYITNFGDLTSHSDKQGIISISHFAPQQLPQQIATLSNGNPLECLPPINIFSKVTPNNNNNSNTNDLFKLGNNYSILDGNGKEQIFHFPVSNNLVQLQTQQQQQTFIPSYELFAPLPLPKKVSEKWMSGKVDKNKKINIGSEYQAEIPNFRGNKGRTKAYKSMDEKLWDPNILETCSLVEVDQYLEFACCSAVPGGGTNKEYALHLLTLSRGNIREALLRLMEKVPSLPAKLRSYSYIENQRWSSEEIMSFQISLVQTGKDFSRISKAIGSKSLPECVCFYYFWKKACVNEYQAMKQIWRDRITLQQSQKSQINIVSSNNNQNHVSFLVSPSSQQIRGICK
ncbi:unnamed protein product [Orchesella dallaii]|uniref:Transcriptional-regulating factor 1 n=1 Tax=Orchesella dallaii TaxID=48710 RepID=A0ABP1PYB7_9HEXA